MVAVAILAAIGAGFFNASAAVLQQGAAKRLRGRGGLPPRQLLPLVRQRRWLGGQACDITAFLLQALALSFGALIFVQPLMVLGLPFTVLLRSAIARERPELRALAGTGLCVVGLSLFLLLARPQESTSVSLGWRQETALAISLAVALAVFLTMAAATRRNWRAVSFALGAGALFGVTAGLVKVATQQLERGILVPLQHGELYAAIVTGLAGVLLTQNALKPGALPAPVAVLTLGDPLMGLAVGLLWLGETITSTTWAIAGESATLLLVIVGVVVLARQSPGVTAPTGEGGPTGASD